MYDLNANRRAFLDTLAHSEIGPKLLAVSDNGYNVLVGSTPDHPLLFDSYATHPHIFNKAMNSTAAGRYQLLGRFFDAYKEQLDLPDFSPDSQDQIAMQLVNECHALPDVDDGLVADALDKCRSRWASLPGSGYGQHENKMEDLVAAFVAAGGTLA